MQQKIFISVVANYNNKNLDISTHSKRIKQEFTLLKIKSIQRNNMFGDTTIDMVIRPMELVYRSELIYDVSNQVFYKTRYDENGTNSTQQLPTTIKPLFETINDVVKHKPINTLLTCHTKQNVLEAIYLTDCFDIYHKCIDKVAYQLTRYKYGKMIPPQDLIEIVEKYPEYLI